MPVDTEDAQLGSQRPKPFRQTFRGFVRPPPIGPHLPHPKPNVHPMNPVLSRRHFLRLSGTAALGAAAAEWLPTALRAEAASGHSVVIVVPPEEAGHAPVTWAAGRLRDVLRSRGVETVLSGDLAAVPPRVTCVLVVLAGSGTGRAVLTANGIASPNAPEALGLQAIRWRERDLTLAFGADARGLVYALLELGDRVSAAGDPAPAGLVATPVREEPANRIRSVMRCFVSEMEDKPWFNDRAMWPAYLDHLASQRFNRFNLSLGIGYDFLQKVTDAYFLFAYPFLVAVPGFEKVQVPGLSDGERERNLEMLRFIGAEAAGRGLEFQLGLWMHGYEWLNSPKPNYTIAGLTPANHAPYCRAAIRTLLEACPEITGVTLRVHGESGVAEGTYDFWKEVFAGVADCGRRVEMDLHAKGIDQRMIDHALATGLPVTVAPKYWGEHLGLPYHQADIRPNERPRPGAEAGHELMALSAGSRSFTRYGVGDLMREDRRYRIMHRIWPGTQRLLLWGDPLTGAAYGRAAGFCGSDGMELMEPLTFKGRRGSGLAGDRGGYADPALAPRWDWEKYRYTLTVWGRSLYRPDTDAAVFRRAWRRTLGPGTEAALAALGTASRILPLVTTAHAPNGGNNGYWPELYINQSLVDPEAPQHYNDTLAPKIFGNVSPFDPQLFSRMNDHAAALLAGTPAAEYSPIEVAQWLEDLADRAAAQWAEAQPLIADPAHPDCRRLAIDLPMQVGLGRFFAAKFRAGVLYGIFEQSGSQAALREAIARYRQARAAWAGVADLARDVYQTDITVGEYRLLRGSWADRLPLIDDDIARLEAKLSDAGDDATGRAAAAIQHSLGRPNRSPVAARHVPPPDFRSGLPLEIEFAAEPRPRAVRLVYRHVNQAERYETAPMAAADAGAFRGTIPAAYTDSPFPLAYYFVVEPDAGEPTLHPGLGPDLVNEPYYVVRPVR